MSTVQLRLGEHIEGRSGNRTGEGLHVERDALTTHGVIVGMTGSGKTGLGIVLLEEILRSGVPALVIDPKGDMGNLALTFPKLDGEAFAPWVDPAVAKAAGQSAEAAGEAAAATWRRGLQDWGLGAEDVAALHAGAPVTLYTPGSQAGVPLSVLGSLAAPAIAFDDAAEELRAEIEAFTSSLLALCGVDADPMSSREHILIATLIERAWRAGVSLDLGELVAQVAQPPLHKVGVFELDRFFPERERDKLAMRLNGLIASPSFAPWLAGAPLDIQRMLFGDDGRPRAAIVYLPHLPEEQRMFAVTLLLSKVVTWMRQQPGTSALRALLYMDEVFGFCPPSGSPPSKRPLLTLLKQARAHDVGVVLATQNPIDLDYKAMSNAGTWMIGRLSTERDKARIVEALRSAADDLDVEQTDRQIGGLGKRQFLLLGTRGGKPAVFTSRFALSYLRGPLTRDEVERARREGLTAAPPSTAGTAPTSGPRKEAHPSQGATLVAADATAEGALPRPDSPPAPGSSTAPAPATASAAPWASAEPGRAQVSAVDLLPATSAPRPRAQPAPAVAEGIRVAVLDPSAAFAPLVGAVRGGRAMRVVIRARLTLSYPIPGQLQPAPQAWDAVWPHPAEALDIRQLLTIDVEERDLRGALPPQPEWLPCAAPIASAAWWRELSGQLISHILATASAEIFGHAEFSMTSRPGESRESFVRRTRVEADRRADIEALELSSRIAAHVGAQRQRIESAGYEIDAKAAEAEAVLAAAEREAEQARLLGDLVKSRDGPSALAAKAAALEQARQRTATVLAARDKIAAARAEIDAFEATLGPRVAAIHARAIERSEVVERHTVALSARDVHVAELAVIYVPSAGPLGVG